MRKIKLTLLKEGGTISRQDVKSQRFLRFDLILFIKSQSLITKINRYLVFP